MYKRNATKLKFLKFQVETSSFHTLIKKIRFISDSLTLKCTELPSSMYYLFCPKFFLWCSIKIPRAVSNLGFFTKTIVEWSVACFQCGFSSMIWYSNYFTKLKFTRGIVHHISILLLIVFISSFPFFIVSLEGKKKIRKKHSVEFIKL